ncbi:MAG: recombination-associated protein RdgC [Lentisphaeria bacterium]|nr:recombination-associated protein RdgC [Lentisphaeria bacterium]MBR7145066.1 recombination-associated protein RdgC [Lentisphaeria bacterium]
MPFDRGSVTVTTFKLNAPWPEDAVELFNANRAGTLDSIKDDVQIGWTTGRCLLDSNLDENSVIAGSCWYLNLRKAERKIPSSLLNAICKREELVYMRANELDFVPSKVKREIKAQAVEQYLMKMPPAIAATPMVYDPMAKMLYLGTASTKQIEDFIGFFYQTLTVEPLQVTPGTLLNEEFGKLETDLPILSLTDEECSDMTPGRDFLTYLWYLSETGAVTIEHPQYGEFEIMVEGPLVFASGDLAKGSGETSVKKGDLPQQSAEAKAALAVGKKLKKAKVTLTRGEDIWSGTFDADKFVISSLNLPEGEELEPDSRFAERMQNILVFNEAWALCFKLYAQSMFDKFEETSKALKDWAQNRNSL